MDTIEFAEKIFYNGNIITMDETQEMVEAVATTGSRILAVGTLKSLKALAIEKTQYINLEGKTMLPGFIDAHSHIYDTALRAFWVDLNSVPLGPVHGIDDVLTLMKEKCAETPEGEWVLGWGYDDSKLIENRHPNRFDLDKISTKHPIAMSHISGWVSVANSYALEICGVNKELEDTESCSLDRDADGKPIGVMKATLCPVMSKVPGATAEEFRSGLKIVSDEYISKGCTTAQEGWWGSLEQLDITQKSIQSDAINIRFVLYPVSEGDGYEKQKHLYPNKVAGEYFDDNHMICMGAMKLTMDGSNQAYTGYLSQPYHVCPEGKPEHCGTPNHSQAWINERVLELHKTGKQVAIHCNGDGAIEMTIYAMEYAQSMFYREDPRFVFIHCQTARTDQLKRIAKLKAVISFFITHTYFWGERHYHRFLGPERALRLNPVQEALDLGIKVTLHNDTYVTPIDQLLLVWSAVNRQSYEGSDMGKKEQGCSVLEALKAITINSAYQGFEDGLKGSIAKGKLADFVVLEENPLTVDTMHIKDIKIVATVINANIVFGTL